MTPSRATAPRGASEKEVQAAILQYLTARRILAFRMNTGAVVSEYNGKQRMIRYGTPGMADILAFYGGNAYWIECKSPTGKQSELQKSFQQLVEAEGHVYAVARCIEDVEAALQK